MQDIDFDELDRAVNSVSAPSAPTVEPSVSDSIPVSVQTTSPASTPAVRRSSGRFMDVVHPSSDMRSGSTPMSERSAPRSEPVEAPVERSSDYPDPLDFHGFKDEPAVSTPAVKEEEPVTTPLESPFLSDAKVEKRPLGAFSTDAPSDEPLLLDAPDEELLTAETEDVENETVAEPEREESKPIIEPTPEPTPAPVEDSPVPASITQQYKEQPSTTDQSSGAIFDTESYHQPLTHTPKKKSGALVIVWIAALILVGAGAGAAVYFFVLPML